LKGSLKIIWRAPSIEVRNSVFDLSFPIGIPRGSVSLWKSCCNVAMSMAHQQPAREARTSAKLSLNVAKSDLEKLSRDWWRTLSCSEDDMVCSGGEFLLGGFVEASYIYG